MNTEHVEAMRETAKHIRRVQELMGVAIANLAQRANVHDASKWSQEEWPYFAEATASLRGLTYGSPEYKEALNSIRPGVEHHHQSNSHHPEFYQDGVIGMNLLDLLEMLADWKAAGERHADGSLSRSIDVNTDRFAMPTNIASVLRKTAIELGWIDATPSPPALPEKTK